MARKTEARNYAFEDYEETLKNIDELILQAHELVIKYKK
jgi:hypothetical protein